MGIFFFSGVQGIFTKKRGMVDLYAMRVNNSFEHLRVRRDRSMIYIDYLDKKAIQNCPSNYVILAGNGELFRVENSKIIIQIY
jgi:hypothetical protein